MGKIVKCTCGEMFFQSDYDEEKSSICHKCQVLKSELKDEMIKQKESEK